MQLEIYIHGNPRGFSYLGPTNEKDSFFQRFYNRLKSVGKELIIESAQPYFYYTFLLCNNVLDTNGRPNSYFGITIRFDAYYKNVANLYTLLDTLCNKWAIGNLLKGGKDNYQYALDELPQNVYESIQTDLVDWIRRAIDDTDLLKLQNISPTNNLEGKLNLIDSSSDNIRRTLQKYGTISISLDYPLLRESENEKRIQALNQQWTDKLNDLQSKHDTAISNAQGLNSTIQTLQGQLSQVQSDLQKVQNEFNQYKSQTKLSNDIINGLREEKNALLKLASFVDTLGVDLSGTKSKHRGNRSKDDSCNNEYDNKDEKNDDVKHFNLKPYILHVILVLAVGFIIWILFSLIDCSGNSLFSFNSTNESTIAEAIEQPVDNPSDTNGVNSSENENIHNDQGVYDVSESQNTKIEEHVGTGSVDINNLRIDIGEFTGNTNYMIKNGAYTIRVYDKANKQTVQGVHGRWKIQDSDFYIGNPSSVETTITPIKSGEELEIQFYVDGYGTPIKRSVLVKESN